MRTVDIYKLAIRMLKKQQKETPNKTFTSPSGEKVTIQDIIRGLDNITGWLYPNLTPEDVTRVVRCKNCCYYKTYKRKGYKKAVKFKACSKDMKRRDPMFYCQEGEEKFETENRDIETRG